MPLDLGRQYGTTSSYLHGGLPTDRCVAEWWISTARVSRIISGEPYQRPIVEAKIAVPVAIAKLRQADPKAARAIQAGVSEQFLERFRSGLAVIGFERSDEAGVYLLGQWDSK